MHATQDILHIECCTSPQWLVVRVIGELDLSSTAMLTDAVDAAMDASDGRVLLDLSQLTFCDVSGLSLIVRLRRRSAAAGRSLLIDGATAPFLHLVDLADQAGAWRSKAMTRSVSAALAFGP